MADALPTKINLTVVTRERKIIDIEVDEVVLPASDGEIGVLPGHTPLLTTLKIGQMRYRVGTTCQRMVLSWGFAEVLPDRVIVLAERGVLASEIDPAAAEAERIAGGERAAVPLVARSRVRPRRSAARRVGRDDRIGREH